jgi:hypothetical protein
MKHIKNFTKFKINESELTDRLDNERADRELEELKFEVLPAQKDTVKKFLIKQYWNFERYDSGEITCIGGKKYDLDRVTIGKDGTFIVTSK